MQDWDDHAIVTGGGSGLGRAIAQRLADRGMRVLIVGRREAGLAETADHDRARIVPVQADVADPAGRRAVARALPAGATVGLLVHNAGTLDPVGPLKDADLASWRAAMAVNVEAPVFLTQGLLGRMRRGSRVLHVSSGAAHRPIRGWGAYCVGKAALNMLYQVYRDELAPEGVLVGSLRPGVVDTPMQAHIREQPADRFPDVDRFVALKQRGQLHSPEAAASYAVRVLLDSSDTAFGAGEWNIDDGPRPESG